MMLKNSFFVNECDIIGTKFVTIITIIGINLSATGTFESSKYHADSPESDKMAHVR